MATTGALLFAGFLLTIVPTSPAPEVRLAGGAILRGVTKTTPSGRQVSAYLGVPFAESPTGRARFAAPKPISLSGVVNVSTAAPTCVHLLDVTFPGFAGAEMWNGGDLSEDCLALNIWIPSNGDGAVMVWIFGGGFYSGSPSLELYDGATLAGETGMIVVNLNYRLGPFGFLYLGTNSSIATNVGLLDQQLALKWIRDNIKQFGGNPNSITLFGNSAGGASVTAHLLSRTSRRYFNRAILQSGVMLNPWAISSPSEIRQRTLDLAELLHCSTTGDDESIVECLRQVDDPVEILVGRFRILYVQKANARLPVPKFLQFGFAPLFEGDKDFFNGGLCSAVKQLDKWHSERPISILFGTNADEGSYWLPYNLAHLGFAFDPNSDPNGPENAAKIKKTPYDESVEYVVKTYLRSGRDVERIRTFYSEKFNGANEFAYRDAVSRLVDDYFFTCDVHRFGDILARRNIPAYAYYFAQRSSTIPWPKWMGVMHGYEVEYVFGAPLQTPQHYTADEQSFSREIMRLWSNFAREGHPRKDWPLYETSSKTYVELNADTAKNANSSLETGQQLRSSSCHLLREELVSSFPCQTEGSGPLFQAWNVNILVTLVLMLAA